MMDDRCLKDMTETFRCFAMKVFERQIAIAMSEESQPRRNCDEGRSQVPQGIPTGI